MGVYIKGMEMPKEGSWVTLRVFPDGQCFLYSWCGNDFDFMENLTAAPVPEPHGRLIDADALNYTMLYKENWMRGTGVEAPAVWRKDIDAAPTVIPASEEGE